MKKIYQNFDKLDVAFQGAFPQHILDALDAAKMEAQKQKEPALAYLGKDLIKIHVSETGAKGGFTYLFDTGPDLERWAVSRSTDTTGWNIFVSVSSMGLALHGYHAMKAHIYELLESFEVKAPTLKNPDTGLPYDKPVESISRVDFCIDFKTPGFQPALENFVAYRVKKSSSHGSFSAHSNGKKVETLTIGKLPNRQICLYNKVKEIKNKPVEKGYWWKIWDIEPKTLKDEIWRVEARAGKKELKERWDITTFDELETKGGDVIVYILQKYRYTVPKAGDTNKARWPNASFWDSAIMAAQRALKPYSSEAERGIVLRGKWEEKRNLFLNNLTGNGISLAALLGLELQELPEVFDLVKKQLEKTLKNEEEAVLLYKKLEKAEKRFAFLAPE